MEEFLFPPYTDPMKKILKAMIYFLITIVGIIVILVIFLFVYYSILDKEQDKLSKVLNERAMVTKNPASSTSSPLNKEVLNLIPLPGTVKFAAGNFSFPETVSFYIADSLKSVAEEYLRFIPGIRTEYSAGGNIQFSYLKSVPAQGYNLDIKPGKILVEYSTRQGLYYSIVSLKVLKHNYSGIIPCVYIEDSPDLAVRGVMFDISRDKVPSRETLFNIAGLLADLKYNHLELYIEGFSFAYPSFKNLWEGNETPVTGEDIQALDAFCISRFIDLVPNQNSLGHMMAWLATDQYKDLAECPKGYKLMGLISMKGTLDPSDQRSIELLKKMTDDLLPNFTSPYFNVNLDEPFELGKGKSKELAKKNGIGGVYLDYAGKMHEIAAAKNKKMLMWADIVMRHPELISQIPKDITLLDWGYESSYPYERHCKILQGSGLEYMVCPGTNSWTSITGRTDNMMATIESATTNGFKYGAKGMLLTDWGDMGHWQYLPVSYAGYVTGAALSWNTASRKDIDPANFLNSYVFCDETGQMGDLALDLGRYNRFEEIPMFNMTTTQLALQFGLRDKIMINAIFEKVVKSINELMKELAPEMATVFNEKYENRKAFDYQGIGEFIDSKEKLLLSTNMKSAEGALIRDEYMNAIRLIRLGVALQNYTDFRQDLSLSEERSRLQSMRELGNQYLTENKRLWMIRNRNGGYDRSIAALNTLMKQVDDRLLLLDKSALSRGLNRFLEKIGTAGAVLYIKSAS
jgi:hexosaminidase